MTQSDFWIKLKQRIREVSSAAADFTEEQALIGKLKFEVLNLKRKIDRSHRETGARICEMFTTDPESQPFEDDEVLRILSEIKNLENQVDLKRQEIANIADHFREKSAAKTSEDVESDEVFSEPVMTDEPAAKPTEPVSDEKPDSTVEEKPKRGRPSGRKTTTKKTARTRKTKTPESSSEDAEHFSSEDTHEHIKKSPDVQ